MEIDTPNLHPELLCLCSPQPYCNWSLALMREANREGLFPPQTVHVVYLYAWYTPINWDSILLISIQFGPSILNPSRTTSLSRLSCQPSMRPDAHHADNTHPWMTDCITLHTTLLWWRLGILPAQIVCIGTSNALVKLGPIRSRRSLFDPG